MEPEVHIIEKYFQEIMHCCTMTNIKCEGNKEIDLLAIDPKNLIRWHVESRVTPTHRLREKATFTKDGKYVKNGLDYFYKEKFEHEAVKKKIAEIFGEDAVYNKSLVVWRVQDLDTISLEKYDFWVESLDDMIDELLKKGNIRGSRDDVLRLLELISIRQKKEHRSKRIELKDEKRLSQFTIKFSTNKENIEGNKLKK